MKKFLPILIFLALNTFPTFGQDSSNTLRIGFLSNRSINFCTNQWKPTVDYLQQKLPQYNLKFVPVTYNNIEEYIKDKKLEFIYINPAYYIQFREKYGLTQLVTIVYHRGIYKHYLFGSVLFAKQKFNINNFNDLKGKRLIVTSPYSFGGWLMVLYEMNKKKFDPFKECRSIIFSNNHDSVMAAINREDVEAGVVRTGILEEYQKAGKINMKDYRIINQNLDYQAKNNFNLLLSTSLYPEWLICKSSHTNETAAKDILESLLQIKESDFPAIKGDYSEFLSAADYHSVVDVLVSLNMISYSTHSGKKISKNNDEFISLKTILFILLPLSFAIIILFIFYQRRYINLKGKNAIEFEKKELLINSLSRDIKRYHYLFNSLPFGILILDKVNIISFINETLLNILKIDKKTNFIGLDFNICLNNWFDILDINKELREKVIRINHILQDRTISTYFGKYYIKISPYSLPDGGCIRIFEDITEEKKNKDRLRQIEKNYELITDGWTDLIWNLDFDLRILYVSPNVDLVTGYTTEEYLNKKLNEIIAPESLSLIVELAEQAVENPSSVIGKRIEFEHINKDGSKQWFETTLTYREDTQNNMRYFAGVSRNITAKKKAENDLKQSEERFRLVFDQAPVGVLILDLDFTIKMVNKSMFKFLGYTSDEIIGKSYFGLFAPEESFNRKDYIIDFLKGLANEISPEFKFFTKSKKIVWGKVTGAIIKNVENEIICYSQVIEDITELKKTALFLKETDLQFKQVWENSFDGMRLTDSEGFIVLVNKAFCNLVKKSVNELLGKPFSVIYQEDNSPAILKKGKERFLNNSVESNFERELTLWNNEKVWFELTNSYIYLENEPKLLLSIFHDITKRKQAEEEIKKYSEQLEEANKSKDKFFSIIAHELKSPFQGSLGISEILSTEFDVLDRQEAKDLIKSLHRSLNNQYNLLKNLLDWSRLQTGRIQCNPDTIIIEEIVKDVLYLLQNNIKNKQIEIELNIEKSHKVFADFLMIRTVITNLIANAIKFTYNKGLIKIYSKSLDEFIEISVEDNGVGIEQTNIDKLFKIDCQISTYGTNNETGTGLGLILCKEMIEKNNGKIGVESRKNLGSKFYFVLPKAQYNGN